MVQKVCKKEVHSGNTLRASHSRFFRRYGLQGCVVRHVTSDPSDARTEDKVKSNWNLLGDGVEYSLNKKGRWMLPEELKNYILCEEHTDDPFNLAVLEQHKLKRQAKAVGYYSTRGKATAAERRTYFNGESVVSSANRARALRQSGGTNEACPEIHYNVFHPTPKRNSIIYNSRFFKDIEHSQDGHSKQNRKKKKRSRIDLKNLYMYELGIDIDVSEEDEQQKQFFSDDYKMTTHLPSLIFGDLFNGIKRVQEVCSDISVAEKETTKSPVATFHRHHYGKGDAILISNGEIMNQNENLQADVADIHAQPKQTLEIKSLTICPVCVILPTDKVTFCSLQKSFGSHFYEVKCLPRKFIINISEKYAQYARQSKLRKREILGKVDLSAYLIFVYDVPYDTGLDVFRVYLNINTVAMETIRIETLFDMFVTSPEEVVDRTLNFLDILPIELFNKVEQSLSVRTLLTMNMLKSVNNWKAESYLPSSFFDRFLVEKQAASLGDTEYEIVQQTPFFCNICLCDIDFSQHGGSHSATALIACNHWFCDNCWQQHLVRKIQEGNHILTCPEFECTAELDECLVLTLIGLHEVKKHMKCRHDSTIQTKMRKWCPNPLCGKVLSAESDLPSKPFSLICECGRDVCFTCLQSSHWPASCIQGLKYHKKLVDTGDDKTALLEAAEAINVKGKNCPSCNNFIVKNGGCPHMLCCCGHDFCWACLEPWPEKQHNDCYRQKDTVGSKNVVVNHIDLLTTNRGMRSKLYVMALAYRTWRNPSMIRKIRRKGENLTKNLLHFSRKHELMFPKELLPNQDYLEQSSHSIAQKTLPMFIKSIVSLQLELCHVMEYTAVCMDSHPDAKKRRHMSQVLSNMEYIILRISEVFELEEKQDLKSVVEKLWQLMELSKNAISALARVL